MIVSHLVKDFPAFYRTEKLTSAFTTAKKNCTCPERDESSPSYVISMYFNIILQSTTVSSKWCVSFRLSHQKPDWSCGLVNVWELSPLMSNWSPESLLASRKTHDVFRFFIICFFFFLLRCPNISLSAVSLCSSVTLRDQVFHPYNMKREILAAEVLIVALTDSMWEDGRFWAKYRQAFPDLLSP